eukprot:TRINITY_DN10453_c0_g1_i1.p1 TRINITY_DN10453_c0_g1~~TRINITY_DN10453_c0_g1_i1.p1  ORF type:complete len:176 (+),score=32.68 TRINITY_DN10453_c0_g1_i1:111-638(+)
MGKLRSNFFGTEFVVYDHGLNPKDTKDESKIRCEHAAILYETNVLGERGPRKMRALIPNVDPSTGEPHVFKPTNSKDGIIQNFRDGRKDRVRLIFNKPPKWNEEVGAFVLNFNGRVDKPSVKNFQLIDMEDEDYIYLQFGRIGEEMFTMDIRWPMSLMQGLSICLSSFDFKFACE